MTTSFSQERLRKSKQVSELARRHASEAGDECPSKAKLRRYRLMMAELLMEIERGC